MLNVTNQRVSFRAGMYYRHYRTTNRGVVEHSHLYLGICIWASFRCQSIVCSETRKPTEMHIIRTPSSVFAFSKHQPLYLATQCLRLNTVIMDPAAARPIISSVPAPSPYSTGYLNSSCSPLKSTSDKPTLLPNFSNRL